MTKKLSFRGLPLTPAEKELHDAHVIYDKAYKGCTSEKEYRLVVREYNKAVKKFNLTIAEEGYMAKRFTIRKYMGDDKYSWAVFDTLTGKPVCTGCIKSEAQYHAKSLEEKYGTKHAL